MASAEQKKSYAIIKSFKGINTKANRTAIEKDEFSWIENAMPIGSGNIRIVASQSNVTYASNSSNNIVTNANVASLYSSNINLTDYIVAFEDDGRAEYVSLTSTGSGNTSGNIATTGTFSTSGVTGAQYKNQYFIIGDPNKGLFAWDGTNNIHIGSVGSVGITNPGSGYLEPPSVTISAPNDTGGIQATAVSTITTGAGGVASITVGTVGTGYTSLPNITVSAPDVQGGTPAQAVATISGGGVVAITVISAGSGYLTVPSVSITGGGGSSAAATASLIKGTVNNIFLTNAGSGYTGNITVTLSAPPSGTTATAIGQYNTFATGTLSVLVTNGGSGYGASGSFSVSFSGGSGGSGAAGTAIVSGGSVVQVIMTNPGSGYTAAPTVSFSSGSGTGAVGIVVLNSSPIVDVATFSGRTWIAQGRTVTYSASTSPFDFTSVSAGSLTLTDETLHGNITALFSANNFLYIFGDESINVFSDLRVSSSGATLFTNTNVSASVGTKRIYAIFPYFRSLLFMNDYGIYALVGSTTSKISDPLDGIFPYIDFTQPVTGGQVLIRNILCAAFNFYLSSSIPYGPGASRFVQAVFFDKKWFITSQGNALNYVISVPVGGLISLYGVTSKQLFKLYSNNTSNVASYIQTALDPMGDSIRTKQALKFGVEATLTQGGIFNITVDSESGSSPIYNLGASPYWVNNSGTTIGWTNYLSNTIIWITASGYYLYKSDAQQYGKYLGLTMTSNNAGFTVNTFEFEHELRVRF